MRVWDLDQLALKFERHADTENVDFIVSFILFFSLCTFFIIRVRTRSVYRSSPTTGQRRCICRRTAPSSCTRRVDFITARGYLALAGPSHITFLAAMRSLAHRATRCTV
jgi:hypothetical protein